MRSRAGSRLTQKNIPRRCGLVRRFSLVKVKAGLFAQYSWRGRTIEYHRAQIRRAYGTRPPSEADEERWAQWLANEMRPTETSRDRLGEAVRQRCRSEKVEPPATGQVERVIASGCRRFEEAFACWVMGRLGPVVCDALEDLLSRPNVLAGLKSDPGPLGLGYAAGRDQQAGHRPVAGADRAGVRRDLGLDRGVVAGTGGPHVPLGLRSLPRAGAIHPPGPHPDRLTPLDHRPWADSTWSGGLDIRWPGWCPGLAGARLGARMADYCGFSQFAEEGAHDGLRSCLRSGRGRGDRHRCLATGPRSGHWLVAPRPRAARVGCQNSATGPDLGFYAARSYSLIRPPRTGQRLIRSWERSATGWSGRGGRSCRLRWGRRPL